MSDAAGIQPDFSFPVGQFADLYGCRQFPPVLFASDFQRITAVRQFCTIEQNSVSAAGAGYFTDFTDIFSCQFDGQGNPDVFPQFYLCFDGFVRHRGVKIIAVGGTQQRHMQRDVFHSDLPCHAFLQYGASFVGEQIPCEKIVPVFHLRNGNGKCLIGMARQADH